eukprot:431278-Prorocentrum_lima.AAC.1
MKLVWGTDKVALVDQDGKEIFLSLHVGPPSMDWDDFSNDVRKKLATSHLAGRHPAPVAPPTINLARMGDEGGSD